MAAALLLLAAVLIDAAIGDPVYPWHPVRLMGKTAAAVENLLRKTGWVGYCGGGLLLLFMVTLFGGGSFLLMTFLQTVNRWLAALGGLFLLYSSIALTDMFRHAVPVATALRRQEADAARQEVQKIVGRDAHLLDEQGIARAAVESVAESFVDGFLSPLFWFSVGAAGAAFAGTDPVIWGVAAAITYRVTNTLDSMVGYRNERYRRFGTAAARSDDFLNFIPARLAIPILTLAALVTGHDAKACWKVALRDRLKHASPNSGHTESGVAGALGIRLGGPTVYPHGTVDKPWLGDQFPAAVDARSIEDCCRLVRSAGWIGLFFSLVLLATLAAATG